MSQSDFGGTSAIRIVQFDEFQTKRAKFKGWDYPANKLSGYSTFLPRSQQRAINLWGWIAILMFVLSPIGAWWFGSYWFLIGLLLSVLIWRSNQKSLEQFVLEKLSNDQLFYEMIQRSPLGERILIVWK